MYIKPQEFWGCDPSLLQDKEIKKKQAQIEEEQAKAPRGLLKSSRFKERQKAAEQVGVVDAFIIGYWKVALTVFNSLTSFIVGDIWKLQGIRKWPTVRYLISDQTKLFTTLRGFGWREHFWVLTTWEPGRWKN